ncbi:Hypothetical_protein [Hexamita inflata]|uniref:Hypothetical_protein n=1 Tax=Hexamita inflata TaxID=28002 RepID=A0AA86PIL5_9EUKA|nr:Hypothetical protein HINF_LOCUS24205 [Hexamita inflata]
MQTIIRKNSPGGIDPETGSGSDQKRVETAYIRVPLHSQFYQVFVGTSYYTKVSKYFFVDCDMCYGFGSGSHKILTGLNTVIFLNCKFSQYQSHAMPNHNGANPKIYIETIDNSCNTFIAAENAAGRSVTEITINVLCEQIKQIYISDTEKLELINQFIQRKNVQINDVLVALCLNGFDYINFMKIGYTNEQVIIALTKNNVDCSDFALTNNISNNQVLIILAKNGVDFLAFIQKQGISNEQVLLLLMKENLDYVGFALKRGIKDEQVLITLMKNNLDYSQFTASKPISNEQILVALAKSNQDYQTFAQKNGFTDEHTLITLMKTEVNIKPFIATKNMSNPQIISIIHNSDLPLPDKFNLLQQIVPVNIQQDRENINSSLIKHEYDLINDRVLKFVNYQQRELFMEIIFKEALLQQKKNDDEVAINKISELHQKNQELQKQNLDIKLQYTQQIANIQARYEADLIKCNNEVETLRKEYQQNLQNQYNKYKIEVEELINTNVVEKVIAQKIQVLKSQQRVSDQEININDSITNQLRTECKILRQQLIEEKLFHDEQLEHAEQQLKRVNQRNTVIQKQLTDEKTQRIIFFEDLQQKQSEITQQLEYNVKHQAIRIEQLENDNQSLQSTLNALREQIEKLNIQEYQKRIDLLTKQLEDKDEYIEKLKEEMEKINVNQLQDKQIEKVLTILKSVEISQQ